MDPYAGKVWVAYRNEVNSEARWGNSGIVLALFDSQRGADKYIDSRKRNDRLRGVSNNYSIVPWLVQQG